MEEGRSGNENRYALYLKRIKRGFIICWTHPRTWIALGLEIPAELHAFRDMCTCCLAD